MESDDDFMGPKRALLDEDQKAFLASNTRPAATVVRKAPPSIKSDSEKTSASTTAKGAQTSAPRGRDQSKPPEARADVVIKESTGIKAQAQPAPPKKKSAFALAREAAKPSASSSLAPAMSPKISNFQIKESQNNNIEFVDQVMNDVQEKESEAKVEPPKFQSIPFPEVQHRLLSLPKKTNLSEKEEISPEMLPITSEKDQINRENRDRISNMTKDEIDDAQKEIFSNLSPALIEKLRSRGKSKLGGEKDPKIKVSEEEEKPKRTEAKVPVKEKPLSSDTFEIEKFDPLEWTKEVDIPNRKHTQPFKESEKLKFYRFDFNGKLLTFEESVAISPAKGLHHHGEEPALAGYNMSELIHLSRSSFTSQAVISLQTLTNIIKNCKKSPQEFAQGDAPLIFEYLCESDFPMTLRLLLDSNKPNLLIAAIDCLHALLCDDTTSAALRLLDLRLESHGIFPLSSKSASKLFHGEFEAEEDLAENEGLSDADIFKEDIIVGFIFTELLPRIRYILEMINLPTQHSKLLDILLRISVHSIEACVHLVECPLLLASVSTKFLKVSIPNFTEDTAKALELFRRVASAAPSLLAKLTSFDLPERIKIFLLPVLSNRAFTSAVELRLVEECFRLMSLFASSQQHISTFIDLFTEFATIIPNSNKSPNNSKIASAFLKFLLTIMRDCVLKKTPALDASHIAPFIQQLIHYFETLPRTRLDVLGTSHVSLVAGAFELFSIYFDHVSTRADKPATPSSILERLQPVLDYFLHAHLFQKQLSAFLQGLPESQASEFPQADRSSSLFSIDTKNLPSFSSSSFLVKEVKNTFFEKSPVVFAEDEEYLNSDRFSEKLTLLKASFFGSPFLMASLSEVEKFPPRINAISATLFYESNLRVLSIMNDLFISTNHFVIVLAALFAKSPNPNDFGSISLYWTSSLRVHIDTVRNGLEKASKNLLTDPLLVLFESNVDSLLASLRTYYRLKKLRFLFGKPVKLSLPEISSILDLLLSCQGFLPPGRDLELKEWLSFIGILFNEVSKISNGQELTFPLNFFQFIFVEMAEDERLRRIDGRKLKLKKKGVSNELNLLVDDSNFLPPPGDSKLPVPYDWIFSLFHKQLEDEEEQVPGLDEVLQGLELVLFLHRLQSKYYLSIPIETRCLHFLHLFLFPSETFRDDKFQSLSKDLLVLLGTEIRSVKGTQVRVDLEKVLGGNLVNFINTFTEIFIHQSYGNQLFAQTLQFFMQKGVPPEYEEALWANLENTCNMLAFKGLTLFPLSTLLISPINSDFPLRPFEDEFDKVVKAMVKCFSSRLVYDRTSEDKLRNSFVYWYLIHHISNSLNAPATKDSNKEKKLTRRSVLNLILKQESIFFSDWEKKLYWSDIEKAVPDFAFHDLKDYRPLPPQALEVLDEDSWVKHHQGS